MLNNTKTAYSLLNASKYLFYGLDKIISKNIFCAQTSHFYDSHGTFFGISSGDVNYPIEDSDVAALSKLILPIEDRRFFSHKGIDVKAIFRAVAKNIRARKIIQGGSTITQQVVRNTIIPYDKSLMRKIIEGILALALEKKYSKQEILKLYFSHVYMGNGIRGFAAASKLICRKRLSEADDLDKCGLIGLVRLPSLTHPENYTNAFFRRRSFINQHLKKNGINIPETQERTVNPIKINRFKKPRFTNIVQHIVSNNKKLEYKEISKVYFTIDRSIQSVVDSVLRETSFEQNVKMVAGVLLENRTSDILAESAWCHGGKESEYSPSYFGRIQPGSTFKPFALLSGLEQGFDLNSTFESAPFRSAV